MAAPFSRAWSQVAREYAREIRPGFEPAAQALLAMLGVGRGDRVLDVACGPGTAAALAHELGAAVVGLDYAVGMVRLARELASDRATLGFLAGDALALPVAGASFDVVVSSFGVSFAPDPETAVGELARVLVPGGRLGLLVWPPGGSVHRYHLAILRHLPVAAEYDPFEWGRPERAAVWLAPAFEALVFHELEVPFEASSPEEAWRRLRTATGRTAAAYAELAPEGRRALDEEMHACFRDCLTADGRVRWDREAIAICGRRSPRVGDAPASLSA